MNKFKIIASVIFLVTAIFVTNAQNSSNGFNYQGVATDETGAVLEDKNIQLEISIYSDANKTTLLWEEAHDITTSLNGFFSLVIGKGNSTGGGAAFSFSDVDFTGLDVHVLIKLDNGSGLKELGLVKLQAIPYAKYADLAQRSIDDLRKINDLEDVDAEGIQQNQILKWNGARYVPADTITLSQLTAEDKVIINGVLQVGTGNQIDSVISNMANAGLTVLVNAETVKNYIDSENYQDSLVLRNLINSSSNDLQTFKNKVAVDSTMFHNLISSNTAAIGTETTRATNAEESIITKAAADSTTLHDFINTNTSDIALNNDTINMLSDSIDFHRTEINTNTNTGSTNATAISTETSRATTAESDIKSKAVADSTGLRNLINIVATGLGDEKTRAEGVESAISSKAVTDSTTLRNLINTNSTNIATNASDISDNADSVTAHRTAINTNITDIATNATDIGLNNDTINMLSDSIGVHRTAINTNITNIATNASDISDNADSVTAHRTAINTNITDIATNATDIGLNNDTINMLSDSIGVHRTAINTNITNIATNASDISDNADSVTAHRTAIDINIIDIATNATDIDLNNDTINMLSDSIGVHRTAINTNITNIATNASDISDNADSVTAHRTAIDINIIDIATNATDIDLNNDTINMLSDSIGVHRTAINTNITNIATNASDISDNADSVTAHRTAINTNITDIATNATDIALNNDTINMLSDSIGVHRTAINTNIINIATNVSDISDNADSVIAHRTAINTNITDIATNATDIDLNNDTINMNADSIDALATIVVTNSSKIYDADGDTKIQVEESADEDIIRFDIEGTEKWKMIGSRLEPVNTGNSIFIGAGAGANDDLSGNNNVVVGYDALTGNTTGTGNIALGTASLLFNTTGSKNTAIGYTAGLFTTGSGNIFLGYEAGFNETGSNKLYIDNSSTSTPLIYGDFSTNALTINGDLTITGTPIAPTASAGTNTTQLATTAFVQTELSTDSTTLRNLINTNTSDISDNADSIDVNAVNITLNNDTINMLSDSIGVHRTAINTNIINIATNVSDISDNADSVTAHRTAINTNITNIATNATDIALNNDTINMLSDSIGVHRTAINTNITNIATNASDISDNADSVTAHRTAINTNITDIATNAADIDLNNDTINMLSDSIDVHRTAINTNITNIATNASDISDNADSVTAHRTAIDINIIDIATNATDIALNNDTINMLSDSIDVHRTAINTNITNIATNASDISDNADSVTAHRTAINSNITDIATNATDIDLNNDTINMLSDSIGVHRTAINTNITDIASNATTAAAAMVKANNLSDVANAGTSRTNLGVAIGSDVQAYDADLDDLADGSLTATKIAGGSVTDTEFQYINTLSSNAQTQISANATTAGAAATKELDNLGTVAINTDLISDTDDTDDLGSSSKEWKDLYVDGIAYVDQANIDQLGSALNANSQAITNVDVNSGAIDGTTIGASSASTGSFTTLATSSTTSLDAATTVNESGASVDIRAEGNTDENLLFLDGSADYVGIGTSTPASKLQVVGEGNVTSGVITISQHETNSSTKYGGLNTKHYTNAEESVSLINGNAQSSTNIVRVGGGLGEFNAATTISFFTATDNTTVTGTEKMTINSDGSIEMNGGLEVSNGSTSAGTIQVFEDTDDGSNKATITATTMGSDVTLTLPTTTGTFALATENLSDLSNAATSRTNLGVAIGSDVQAYDADLADLADGSLTATKVADGTVTDAEFQYINTLSSNAQTQITANATTAGAALVKASNLSDVSNAGTSRTNLGVAIGSDVQAYDTDLDDLADGTLTATKVENGSFMIDAAGTSGEIWTSDGSGVGGWSSAANAVLLTTNQTIAGTKTFSSDMVVNGQKFGRGGGNVSRNSAFGLNALNNNSSGTWNTAMGAYALQKNTTSWRNTAIGNEALSEAIPGSDNTALGNRTLMYSTASNNTAVGSTSLQKSTTGSNNTAVGQATLFNNTTGGNNTANGYQSLYTNTTGSGNTSSGTYSLNKNTTGIDNTASGYASLNDNISGNYNTATGRYSLYKNTIGNNNTSAGLGAGYNSTGDGNVFLGYNAGYNETGSDNLYIDNSNTNTPLIYGDFSGNTLTVNGDVLIKDGTSAGNLQMFEASGSGTNKVTIQTQAMGTDYTLTLPVDDGTASQVLSTDGSGSLSWTTAAAGDLVSTNNLSDVSNAGTSRTNLGVAIGSDVQAYDADLDDLADGTLTATKVENGSYMIGSAGTSTEVWTSDGSGAGGWAAASGISYKEGGAGFSNGIIIGHSTTGVLSAAANNNVAVGVFAMDALTIGDNNVFLGNYSGTTNTTGKGNVGTGFHALSNNLSGDYNIATGYEALYTNSTGLNNVAIGYKSGYLNETGTGNIFLGSLAGYTETGSNKLYIDNANTTSPLIYGDFSSNALTFNGDVIIKDGTAAGNIQIYEASGSGTNKVTIQTQAMGTDYTLTLPVDDGTNGQVLSTDGSGSLSWASASSGDLVSTNNLSDVSNASTARTNLGVAIGSDVQAYDAQLADIAGLSVTDGNFIVGNGSNFVLESGSTARTSLGLGTMATASSSDYLALTGGTLTGSLSGTGATFSNDITVNGIVIGEGAGSVASNVSIGINALVSNSAGINNVAIGGEAGFSITGSNNVAIGFATNRNATEGDKNIAIGYNANYQGTSGDNNISFGTLAYRQGNSGSENIAIGTGALYAEASGSNNIALGNNSSKNNNGGEGNITLGYQAGNAISSGDYNTVIGYDADVSSGTLTNATAIGNGAVVTASNKIQLGNGSVTSINTSASITAGAVTYPNTDGSANQILETDGSGTLSWVTPSTTPTWTGYSPTISNSGSNIASRYKADGDMVHVSSKIDINSITAASCTTTLPQAATYAQNYPVAITNDTDGSVTVGVGILTASSSTMTIKLGDGASFSGDDYSIHINIFYEY